MQELLKYRFDRAVETLEVARELYASGKFMWRLKFFQEKLVEKSVH